MVIWIIVIAAGVLLDQITKILAAEFLIELGREGFPIIKDFLHLTYVENTGAAFGILKDQRWIFMLLSVAAIIGLTIYLITQRRDISIPAGVFLALIISGGIGNMIDRIVRGYVIDFIDFTVIDFYIFNMADTFVCVGAVLTVIYMLFYEAKEAKEKRDRAKKNANG
jgi:lipoprotein signal peptidase